MKAGQPNIEFRLPRAERSNPWVRGESLGQVITLSGVRFSSPTSKKDWRRVVIERHAERREVVAYSPGLGELPLGLGSAYWATGPARAWPSCFSFDGK